MYINVQAPPAAAITLSAITAASTTTFAVLAGEPGAGTQANLNAPGSNRLLGQSYIVRAAGLINLPAGTFTSSATPFSVWLTAANTASFAAAAANTIATSSAVAIFTYASAAATSVPFEVEAQLNAGTILTGRQTYSVADPNAVVSGNGASTTIAHNLTGVNYATEPPLQFAVAIVTVAAANWPAGATATLNEFNLES
jgi:hypothetical protein